MRTTEYFTITAKIGTREKVAEVSKKKGVTMSKFVDEAIQEKIEREEEK